MNITGFTQSVIEVWLVEELFVIQSKTEHSAFQQGLKDFTKLFLIS